MPTRKEVTAAKAVMDAYYKEQQAKSTVTIEQRRKDWIADNVGKKFLVTYELTRDAYDNSECYHRETNFSFTATLLSADGQDGKMEWDNGVTTDGIFVHKEVE